MRTHVYAHTHVRTRIYYIFLVITTQMYLHCRRHDWQPRTYLHTCLHCNFRALITHPLATVRQLLIPRKLKVKCNSLCKSHHSCKEDEYIIANTAKNIQFSCSCNTICIEIVNITKYHDTSRSNSDHTTLLQLIIHLLTCGIQHSYSITYSSAIAKEIIISHYTLSQLQRDCWHVVHTSSIELRYLTSLLQLQGGC